MADYRTDHQEALQDMRNDGSPVLFGSDSPGTYDPGSDTWTGSSKSTVEGFAIEVPGDPDEYEALRLTLQNPITLQFVPTTFNTSPAQGQTLVWAGLKRTVKSVRHVRPAQETIAARVVLV
jgi:hypothetical protein